MAREGLFVEVVSTALLRNVGREAEQHTKLHTGDPKLA